MRIVQYEVMERDFYYYKSYSIKMDEQMRCKKKNIVEQERENVRAGKRGW